MTKGLWVYCPSPMFSKTCTFLYSYILSHLFSFWNNFPPPPHLPICLLFFNFFVYLSIISFFFIKSPQPFFHKSYPQPKTFLKIWAVPSSTAFCSNAVLITTPSFSTQFFSFFDALPSAPTITGMTLMPLMFHILLISPFSSWYLSIFSLSFSLTLMSPGIAISIMAQLFLFLFTTTIFGFLALTSLSHWSITYHKIFTSSFSTTPSGACSCHFPLFRLYFPYNFQRTILATLSRLLLYSFCVNFLHSITIWDTVSLLKQMKMF